LHRSSPRCLLSQIDLNALELFKIMSGTLNLTLAGCELGLSQPAMSCALAKLKEPQSDSLLVRLPYGLAPTPVADRVYESSSAALEIVRRSL